MESEGQAVFVPGRPLTEEEDALEMGAWFCDDDARHLRWIDENPNGYVTNCGRQPAADYLMLHQLPLRGTRSCGFEHLGGKDSVVLIRARVRAACLHGWPVA